MIFTLQLWWVGWDLHDFNDWSFIHFLVLIFASIFMYGAAEMALPDPDDGYFDMLSHSQALGKVSAMSLLLYFLLGPYINIIMFNNPIFLSLVIPLIGVVLMLLVILIPRWFKWLSIIFGLYSLFVLFVTA
ncbi:hypothetical protein OAP14_07400 [Aliiglaciecola sp.]|nr:hypothetical protein [Aliiglaciecola sp.]